ncbi:hypothetical protein, partial [Gluconacetobacter diazotrophicus]|uniref:hypothetical protein n=1 Tax=Gluconacetobacter diazotrophicus TaxID=33996 RepID=UPI001C820431
FHRTPPALLFHRGNSTFFPARETANRRRPLRPDYGWHSVGRFLHSLPHRPSFFPEARWATPACENEPEGIDAAG